ncbi:MAG: 4-hydroxy-3-methylbut-2-enyl diphosphate reductase [Clostridia bacterium]|nr:4-hydroxy-3-methylbut-2-enyl diphosphate reductase [Clostridia bacterium]
MSKIHLADTAGFCFGVDRAVQMVDKLLDSGRKVYTLGPIIHNPQVIEDMAKRGVSIATSPSDVEQGGVMVIRSHGVSAAVYEEMERIGIEYVDATCPFVAKIHSIVSKASDRGDTVLIAGDAKHPEVLGISGHCSGPCYVFKDEQELEKITENLAECEKNSVTIVAQTTYNSQLWEKCVKIIKKVYTNATIFDTICNATLRRQQEAVELSRRCELMLVIGGRTSSNTAKLHQICSQNCEAYLIESAAEIPVEAVRGANDIGITAGASTPAGIIKEVLESMSEIFTGDENFAALLEESFRNANTNGKVVEGTVVGIAPGEIYVDVGRKQSGIVLLEELTDNPNLTPADCVNIGDKLELMILRTNDQEGYIYLSKRILDSARSWEEIKEAAPKIVNRPRRRFRDDDEEDVVTAEDSEKEESAEAAPEVIERTDLGEPTIFKGVITEVVKGGVIVSYKGVKVFIPASQATLNRNEPLEDLLKKEARFIVLEVNPSRRRAVGSIRAVLNKERKAKEKAFWENIEVGQKFTGSVKSLTSYGAFVDLGAVDGMVHISELSWNRIKDPSEVVSVGDIVEVVVKKVDAEKRKISLGYKKTEDNPWEILKNNYPVGTIIEAPVVGTPTFGAFVRILPGIDGLVHISQLSTSRVDAPTDVVAVGDIVRAVVTEIDFDRKRVSLSIRQLLEETAEEEAPAEETAEAEESAE